MSTKHTGVYLLHLATPLRNSNARHYIGASRDVAARIRRHRAGFGSIFTRTAYYQGREMQVVNFWPTATYSEAARLEAQLKRAHHHHRLCPVCTLQERLGIVEH